MKSSSHDIQQIIGYYFNDTAFIHRALAHSSYSHEHNCDNYERLEFLGDSLLEAITTAFLYHNFDDDEGTLSKLRAKVVSAKSLAEVVRRMGISTFIMVGGSIDSKDIPENILADVYESIVASIMLDGGLAEAKDFVLRTLLVSKDNILDIASRMVDYKTVLQERLQHIGSHATYDSTEVVVDGKAMYRVSLLIDGAEAEAAVDSSKKVAQEAVAKKYLERNGGIF